MDGQSTPQMVPNLSMNAHTTAKFGSVVHFSLTSSGCSALTSAVAMVLMKIE